MPNYSTIKKNVSEFIIMYSDNNKIIYDIQKNIPFWFNYKVVSLNNLTNNDDYRLTEIVSNLYNRENIIYLT